MAFDEVQFPTTISAGASGGPVFKTDVIVVNDGYERRNQNWSQGRISYDASYGIRSMADIATVLKFFRARQGMVRGFRFRDPLDYTSAADGISAFSAIDQLIGIGNSSATQFQLVKNYINGGVTQQRTIKKPVNGQVLVAVDGLTQINGVWTGRASTAMYVDASGLLVQAAIDVPRWSYDPVTLLEAGLIVEPTKTNYCKNSNGAGSWSKTASTVVLAVTASPDGTTNAASLTDNGTSSGHYVLESNSVNWTAGNRYTQAFYLKANTASIAQITFPSGSFTNIPYANFNLATGEVTISANCTALILPAGNGWYRCAVTAIATTTQSNATGVILGLVNDNPTSIRLPVYSGTTKRIYFYGAQIEDEYLTSLIPTSGATANRSADDTTYPAGTFYGQTHGVTYDHTTGLITFGRAPGNALEVRAGFEFDVPARFDADDLDVKLAHYNNGQFSIPITEVLL